MTKLLLPLLALTFAALSIPIHAQPESSSSPSPPPPESSISSPDPPPYPSSSSSSPVAPPEPTDGIIRTLPVGANLTTVEIYNQYRQVVENVTYYTNSYGEAVYDDDIIWGSEELLLSWRVTGDGNVPSRNKKRYYAVKPADGWPSFPIPYRYDSAGTKSLLQPYVDAALAKWKSLLPCLSFEERAVDPTFAQGIVVITSAEVDGCQSNAAFASVGFANAKPHINLASGCLGRQPKHEWGHQLGLFHEHKRPDRNDWVDFHCAALQPEPGPADPPNKCVAVDCCVSPSSSCCALIYQFTIDTDPSKFQVETAYDFDSIMHYPGWAFARPGQNTLTRKSDGTPYPYNTEISTGDVAGVRAIYTPLCDTPPPAQCGTCNPISGLNKCDITTSCIATDTAGPDGPIAPGTHYYCACRAGFKATTATDPTKQFRLPMPGQEYRVFVPENTPCNELCSYPHGFSPLLCAEVDLQNTCPL